MGKTKREKPARAGGTGFTGKRPKDKRVVIGKSGFAGGVGGKAHKVPAITKLF